MRSLQQYPRLLSPVPIQLLLPPVCLRFNPVLSPAHSRLAFPLANRRLSPVYSLPRSPVVSPAVSRQLNLWLHRHRSHRPNQRLAPPRNLLLVPVPSLLHSQAAFPQRSPSVDRHPSLPDSPPRCRRASPQDIPPRPPRLSQADSPPFNRVQSPPHSLLFSHQVSQRCSRLVFLPSSPVEAPAVNQAPNRRASRRSSLLRNPPRSHPVLLPHSLPPLLPVSRLVVQALSRPPSRLWIPQRNHQHLRLCSQARSPRLLRAHNHPLSRQVSRAQSLRASQLCNHHRSLPHSRLHSRVCSRQDSRLENLPHNPRSSQVYNQVPCPVLSRQAFLQHNHLPHRALNLRVSRPCSPLRSPL